MTWWGPMGCLVGNLFWRPGKLLMIPLLAFGWESVREKSRPVKSVKIDIHRRTAVLGSLRHGARYHISCVCQQTYLPSRHRWTLYSNPGISHCVGKILHFANCALGNKGSFSLPKWMNFWKHSKDNWIFMEEALSNLQCSCL